MKLETVYSSNIPIDCHILKGRLETEGIPCFIFDENIIWVNPFKAIAIGGAKLKVPSDKVELSFEIIYLTSNDILRDENGDYSISEILENEMSRQNEILSLKSKIRKNYSILDDLNFNDYNLIDEHVFNQILDEEKSFNATSKKQFKFSLDQFYYELFDFDRSIFKYFRTKPVEFYLEKEIVDNYDSQSNQIHSISCPYCNSNNTAFGSATDKKWDIPYLLLSILFMSPFFPYRKKHHCFNCGTDFNKQKNSYS